MSRAMLLTAVLFATSLQLSVATGLGDDFRPGARVVTIGATALMAAGDVRAIVPPGRSLIVHEVKDPWVGVSIYVNGQRKSGWVNKDSLSPCDMDLLAVYAEKELLTAAHPGARWGLPAAVPLRIHVMSNAPVNVAILSTERKDVSIDELLKTDPQQVKTHAGQRGDRLALDWTGSDQASHYLVLTMPDASAPPVQDVKAAVWIYRKVAALPEPVPGRGLIIGRFTLASNGEPARQAQYADPLLLHIAHRKVDEQSESEESDDTFAFMSTADDDSTSQDGGEKKAVKPPPEVIKVVADSDGYFAVANLEPGRCYWLSRVEGTDVNFTPSRSICTVIRSSKCHSEGKTDVRDLGHTAVEPLPDGGTRQDIFAAFEFPVDRHEWFLDRYVSSGWVPKVESDRLRIETRLKTESGPRPADEPHQPDDVKPSPGRPDDRK